MDKCFYQLNLKTMNKQKVGYKAVAVENNTNYDWAVVKITNKDIQTVCYIPKYYKNDKEIAQILVYTITELKLPINLEL